MNYAIIDGMNLFKRYACFVDEDDIDIESCTKIFNRVVNISKDYDMTIIVSDNGYNIRAKSILSDYKANRNRSSGNRKEGFINYTKEMLSTAFHIIEEKNIEADMIIYLMTNYIKKLDNKATIIIYSSDSDFYQLLDEDVAIYDWSKKCLVTKDNWYKLDNKLKGSYINYKNYSLYKSIVSDISDNIIGISGIGWKKISRINELIDNYYEKNIVINNVTELIKILETIQVKEEISKKDRNFIDTIVAMFISNKSIIERNQRIIDLSMVEVPFIFKIMTTIKESLFDDTKVFDQKEFFKKLKIDMYRNDESYNAIKDKNSKNFYLLYNIIKKYNNTSKKLKEKEKEI